MMEELIARRSPQIIGKEKEERSTSSLLRIDNIVHLKNTIIHANSLKGHLVISR